ncbi:MAG: copper resistance protein CopC [Xanthobacteraceae bacterium]
MRLLITVITSAVIMLAPVGADAHAHLDHASPPVGATVPTAPPDVTIWFTQKLEAAFSGVDITGPSGASVIAGAPQISGNTMKIGIKADGPGAYHVRWRAVSVDTHKTEGNFTFTVGGQ